jgi:hypothetical protein
MPRRNKPTAFASPSLRREIASLAARMMAEDGIDDYGHAKRKAARSLGVGDGEVLPGNDEVEAELRAYQAIYQEDEQPQRLRELRGIALDVMEFLADFNPHLTGAVLDGTAGRYAPVDIDLFADSSKDVEITLLSRNISYDISEKRLHDGQEAKLRMEWDGTPIFLSIYPPLAERQLRRNPQSGHIHNRAKPPAVRALLAVSPTQDAPTTP